MTKNSHRHSALSDAQRIALLDRLDQEDAQEKASNRRAAPRLKYRKTDVALHVIQPGGGATDIVVSTRDLCANGVSFLYWSFLYTGTVLRVVLNKRMGGEEVLSGKVVWCRHIFGLHHLIGVKFATRIFPKLFTDPSEWDAESQDAKIDPKELNGKILLVDDQEIDRLLFSHHLQGTNLEVFAASTAAEAVALLKKHSFNLVVSDLNLTEISGEDAIKQFRSAGYQGRILILTAETSTQRMRTAMEAGAAAVLHKPYTPHQLLSTISQWLAGVKHDTGDEAIISELAGKPGIDEMLTQYVGQVLNLLQQLRAHIDAQNFDLVRKLCQTLKGTGTGYGYPLLSEFAGNALKILDTSMSVTESMTELCQLENVARRISAHKAA